MERSKVSDLDIFSKPDKVKKEVIDSGHVTKSFRLTNEQARLLKEYTERIQPGHLMITEADIIRYMILHFDVEAAREDFFKI